MAKNIVAVMSVLISVRVIDDVAETPVFKDRLTEGVISLFTGILGILSRAQGVQALECFLS